MDNLPSDVTSFVGRRRQLSELRQWLSQWRLVTLTGSGGVGKTRLAVQLARQLRRSSRDGVWLVELAPLNDGELLAEAIAGQLGVRSQSSRSASAALTEFLRDKRLLLLLDNCEHVLWPCAALVTTLLHECPDLKVVTTSRQPLGVAGERLYPVPSLLEESAGPSLEERPDVRLFADRAAAASGFALSPANLGMVAQICERLDGIPLAIELAAVWLRLLSLEEFAQRLEDPMGLLSSAPRRSGPARQQTLSGLMTWSYELCSAEEQQLWARLSVFAGGFDLQAAESVCSDDEDDLNRAWVLHGLVGLVDKSIVTYQQHEPEPRYRMLDSVRQYGQQLLEATGQQEMWRRRHRDYYLSLAQEAESDWFGPRQLRWSIRLQAEHANMRQALDFCCAKPEHSETGLGIATALRVHWVTGTGYLGEGQRWLERLLEIHTQPTVARARGLWVAGWLALLHNDMSAVESRLAESRSLALSHADCTTLAYVTQLTGAAAEFTGNLNGALSFLEKALEGHRATNDRVGVAFTLSRLASVNLLLAAPGRAAGFCEESIAMSDNYGEQWFRAHALWLLGMARWLQEDYEQATSLEQECIQRKTLFDDQLGIAVALEALAWISADSGEAERAATLLGALNTLWRTRGLSLLQYMHDFHELCVHKTEQALGQGTYAKAFDNGCSFSLTQTLRYALAEPTPSRKRLSTTKSEPAGGSPLTNRQTGIASLIADGLTNRQIANRLLISPRTVDAHVENILTRLGLTNRAQIATWITSHKTQTHPR